MATPYSSFQAADVSQSQQDLSNPASGRARGTPFSAKRGRKPKGNGTSSPRPFLTPLAPASGTATPWALPAAGETSSVANVSATASPVNATTVDSTVSNLLTRTTGPVIDPALVGVTAASSVPSTPRLESVFNPTTAIGLTHPPSTARLIPGNAEEEVDGDDEMLPAMADDDYSAQLSWQSQSKDNLKVLMDNFSPAQYDRFEAYRRHALPKQAVRKVIQQTLGYQVSQPVAQIIAGFSKVFVGEIVEKAREVQTRRGETGPLSPDHLREAYRAYQAETGRVGAARPLRSKRLFVR